MANSIVNVPLPRNEPALSYAPGTPERTELKAKLVELAGREIDIPLVVAGQDLRTGRLGECRMPHRHAHRLGRFHEGSAEEVRQAIDAGLAARREWAEMAWYDRAAIFLKAADLLAGPWRQTLNAATMLGQSKTPYQAEVDAACELIDFWRFNAYFMQQLFGQQPQSAPGIWDRVEHRALEGFVFAVTPFNFTSIAGNLPTAPALLGNVVLWKPSPKAVYSAHYLMELLRAAGLPPGVINLVPGPAPVIAEAALTHPELAGVHFTGSTTVFRGMWRVVGENIGRYRTYPRLVGETGGKDFVFVHASADPDTVVTALVRGAFEYQGQKCSAASRAYLPESLWPEVEEKLLEAVGRIKVGDVTDFSMFMGALIDREAFEKVRGYLTYAQGSEGFSILCGGGCDDREGYFVEPTVIRSAAPRSRLMEEEIFGPVLTVYVYPDADLEEAVDLCDTTSPYGLTGSVFAGDRRVIARLSRRLRDAAGNFYINDKPTGAVVGQQPFGGARASGTNDKAGSLLNLQRWVSQRTIKENFCPPTRFEYPHMLEP
ncbi:MAG: L-glutamate gamma-semialdehyde dehydrogenase [Deltaproteobacteria bacterium]|nr:L-glutamate gamma-semialdehyde dehydrogenase [Deltaproteobacteria bacterium]